MAANDQLWPGSVHDSAIFNNSGLKQYLETQQVGSVLGDSGYGLKTFLLTPKLNPITQQEVRYNAAHRRGRCLHKSGGCLPFQPQRAAKVVVACMRLQNLCVQFNVAVPQVNATENEEIDDNIVGDGIDVNAQQARQLIIDNFKSCQHVTILYTHP
ncbi:putative nuclease HARBI1 [Dreissena polymorpha]|uniref:putative nuclease HARBI1 n=1 Tax=Dreissena polymorpha TaxID=45954 RepID=UPI0022651414|nr:putative nuclease HARBI1 [Dreissena polymorpha]